MISCSPHILSRSTGSQGLSLFGKTVKVSLTFFKSVSQLDNVLIVSQMLRLNRWDCLVLYIEKDFNGELLSVFPSLPRSLFRIPDSGFWISCFSIRPGGDWGGQRLGKFLCQNHPTKSDVTSGWKLTSSRWRRKVAARLVIFSSIFWTDSFRNCILWLLKMLIRYWFNFSR